MSKHYQYSQVTINVITPENIYGFPLPSTPKGWEITDFRPHKTGEDVMSVNGMAVTAIRDGHGPSFILSKLADAPQDAE